MAFFSTTAWPRDEGLPARGGEAFTKDPSGTPTEGRPTAAAVVLFRRVGDENDAVRPPAVAPPAAAFPGKCSGGGGAPAASRRPGVPRTRFDGPAM
jgi:hypothetical protein